MPYDLLRQSARPVVDSKEPYRHRSTIPPSCPTRRNFISLHYYFYTVATSLLRTVLTMITVITFIASIGKTHLQSHTAIAPRSKDSHGQKRHHSFNTMSAMSPSSKYNISATAALLWLYFMTLRTSSLISCLLL